MKRFVPWIAVFIGVALLAGCATQTTGQGSGSAWVPPAKHRSARRAQTWPIQNVVIIVQENRTVDNLFQFLPGASTATYGYNGSTKVTLQPEALAAPFDLGHTHANWVSDYANGKLNGFGKGACKGSGCPANAAYGYVPQRQVQPYYTLAETYTFADEMFESDQGPSFPSHQYLVSGTSTTADDSPNKADNNGSTPSGGLTGGCDSSPGSFVQVITPQGTTPKNLQTFPCFERLSLMNEMDTAGIGWAYYQDAPGAGIWHGVDAIESIWANQAEMAANVISPPPQVLTDIESGNLKHVVWVTPEAWYSDHPNTNDGAGPSWVSAIVNAIGQSQYWQNTAIFIVWDDWGGWYDHVPPQIYNSFELGFRVPLIVVSPYAKQGYVSHVPHEFGSILKFTEEAFDLPPMGTTDVRADDLSDCFDFTKPAHAFRHVNAPYPAAYFLQRRSGKRDEE